MPRIVTPLSDSQIKRTKPPETGSTKLYDGDGLYLLLSADGGRYWRMDYTRPVTKKRNTLAFGSYPHVSLADARQKRTAARQLIAAHIDPAEQRDEERRIATLNAANTFEAVAIEWMSKRKASEATKKKDQYLLSEAIRELGSRPIKDVLPIHILQVCQISEKQGLLEKASKTRAKIGQVMRYAVATGRCERDPTIDLRGALETPMVKHHASVIEPERVAQLLRDIQHYSGRFTTVQALNLLAFTFVRPGELRHAKWADINLESRQWCYTPAKTRKQTEVELIVPLADQAIEILVSLKQITGHSIYVFPATHTNTKPMSENTLNQALRRMGWEGAEMCGHGFRAMARTILEEQLGYEDRLIEMQLGHQVRDMHGRAYNRTKFLDQRRQMMQVWADYLYRLKQGKSDSVG